VVVENLAAPVVDNAGGRADVRVRRRGDVFFEEVDQSPFALKKREEEQPGGVQALRRIGSGRKERCGRRLGKQGAGALGELGMKEDAKKEHHRQPEAGGETRGWGWGGRAFGSRENPRGGGGAL